MTTRHQETPQERTFYQLIDEGGESLSEAAQTVVGHALLIAYTEYRINSLTYVPQGYEDDHMKTMRSAAAELTEHDCEGLAKIWRAALAAAASIDPYDYETLVGWREYPADLYRFYRMVSSKVEEVESETRRAEFRKKMLTEHEPIDDEDASF
jgi:hypothetical protein